MWYLQDAGEVSGVEGVNEGVRCVVTSAWKYLSSTLTNLLQTLVVAVVLVVVLVVIVVV